MSANDLRKLKQAYARASKPKPWKNEDFLSGSKRLARDGIYAGAGAAVPLAAGRQFRLRNAQLGTVTAAGSAMFNLFVDRTGKLIEGLDWTRSAAYDIVTFKKFIAGMDNTPYDYEREYDVADYYYLKNKMKNEGTLPSNWEFTFESIPEDGFGFTDAAVASLFGLYVAYQNVIGGPVSLGRMSHWWNTELQNDDRAIQREMGHGYRFAEEMQRGESLDDVRQQYNRLDNEYSRSAYTAEDDVGFGEEFAPGAI
jgi:hypothetical protein